ncbi:g6505 [Coccomyxa elongata]
MALSAVAERVPDILAMGVPIPEMISFDKFNVFSDRRELDMYGKKKINHFGLDMELRKELNPLPLEENDQDAPAPWEEWTAWDFRAYMEKRRQHERQHADFVRRQNAVGQNDYLNVSPFTDHRILTNYIDQTGELPSRSTHEEFMDLITNNGCSVHPNAVSIREQDPLERADWFQEGVHHVPETEDFLHALGHWKSSDHDLIWRREEAASPTLNEAFADFEDALPTDRESVTYEGAEPIMSSSSTSFEGKDSEDSSEPEAGDDAFEQGN